MRKFQEWMDSQLYSNHLNNLSKIKERSIIIRTRHNTRSCERKVISLSKHESRVTSSQSTYFLNHQRRQMEKNQMKNEEIEKQNCHLANRLISVPPVISRNKQIESYNKRHNLVRQRSEHSKVSMERENKLKNFLQLKHRNFAKGIHKFLIKVMLFSIPKVPEGNFNTFWLELSNGSEKVVTQHFQTDDLLFQWIVIPLKTSPSSKKMCLTLHCCRKLEYIDLGTYSLSEALEKKKQKTAMSLYAVGNVRQNIELQFSVKKLPQICEQLR